MKAKPSSIFGLDYFCHADENSKKSYFYTLIATVITVLILRYFENMFDGKIWDSWKADTELNAAPPVYTEQRYINNLFRTEMNTWSNLCYVVVGYHAMSVGYQDYLAAPQTTSKKVSAMSSSHHSASNYLMRSPQFSFFFGIACLHLGIGSGLFHASLTVIGRQLDVASMYSPLMVLIAMMICRWYPTVSLGLSPLQPHRVLPAWPFHFVFITVAAVVFFVYKWELDALLRQLGVGASSVILPLLIITTYVLAGLDRGYYPQRNMERRLLVFSFVCLLLGVTCRVLDVKKKFSSPTSLFQGHSFWHLLTSLALYYMYSYQRTESAVSSTDVANSTDV